MSCLFISQQYFHRTEVFKLNWCPVYQDFILGFYFLCPKKCLAMSVQEPLWSHGSAVACCRVGSTECSSTCMGPFGGGYHYLYYLHHSLASGQITGREHSPSHQQKIGLKIYWTWPCPSEQDPVSPSINLSHQEASISLLSFSIRGQKDWKPQSQKTSQSDHMDHSLV